jgi:hypothetical protein
MYCNINVENRKSWAVCEVSRKKNMITCYHDNMITLSHTESWVFHVITLKWNEYALFPIITENWWTVRTYHKIS